jgi:hypothetical protein
MTETPGKESKSLVLKMFNDTVRIQIYRRSKEVNVRLG